MGRRAASGVAAAGLAGLAGLRIAWAAGSSWPFASRAELADAVVGTAEVPGPAACLAVAGALSAAAALTGGWPARRPVIRAIGTGGAAAILAARGALGLAGRTSLISPGSDSHRFRRLERVAYSPLCLALAGLMAAAVRPDWPYPATEPGF